MKKNFLLALLGIVAMLTSCNKEEVGGLATNKTASFNVSVNGGVKTRTEVKDLTRYVMEVYRGDATGTPEIHKEQNSGVFTDVALDNAQQYTILFWADYGTPSTDEKNNAANEYNVADLKAARVAEGKQPTKAAYSGVSRLKVNVNESANINVTLAHAVSEVNFVQTEDLTSATNTFVVSYPESYSLNVDNNSVAKIEGDITHNFDFNQKIKGTLGTSYIIAATSAPKTVLEITAKLNSETAIAVSNVPFERNFKTNISGAYSSKYEANLTVTHDDDWDSSNNDVNFQMPKIGDFYYFDKTLSLTYTDNVVNPCIGIVYEVSPNGKTGMIVSLDETIKGWEDAQLWKSSKTLPSGMEWSIPSSYELSKLHGAWNGGTAENTTARNAFNAQLVEAGGTLISANKYWTSTFITTSVSAYVNFDNGETRHNYHYIDYRVRVISAF